jgi:hypothetical protein
LGGERAPRCRGDVRARFGHAGCSVKHFACQWAENRAHAFDVNVLRAKVVMSGAAFLRLTGEGVLPGRVVLGKARCGARYRRIAVKAE